MIGVVGAYHGGVHQPLKRQQPMMGSVMRVRRQGIPQGSPNPPALAECGLSKTSQEAVISKAQETMALRGMLIARNVRSQPLADDLNHML